MKRQLNARKSTLPDVNHREDEARQLLAALPSQEQRIVRMRFGIDSEDYAVKEVARVLGISEAEVRTVEDKFLGRFRQTGPT
ncbi:MAG TPA: sigma factor-like helix-turn-helix DNA-binding protein [Candidatus Binatus sp.]|uniref:sigma factor-like helix-turn-helix DNA-binding protein n=1 Tax=Candidatus Binatus sp. TaxID=2811406 RepID=UPI002B46788B|nr:sigma factor-like helix-turn-helix DNA-binding protein [Candidatus Binatus sp.]HKN11838.1 sigma factor-like helix-turn-helix DNA-binding protein [Candidatus Binatus sp.]